jgi:hypothetical protein
VIAHFGILGYNIGRWAEVEMRKTMCFLSLLACSGAGLAAQQFELSFLNGVALGNFKNSYAVGIAPALHFSRCLRVEAEVFYYPRSKAESRDSDYSDGVESWARSYESAITMFFSAVAEMSPKSRLSPYVVAGGGRIWERYFLEHRYMGVYSKHIDTSGSWQVAGGIGLRWRLSARAGLRFDCRLAVRPDWDEYHDLISFVRLSSGFYVRL